MIGESILVLLRPRRYISLWRGGPASVRHAVDWFAHHPCETRFLGILELTSGLVLALRETDQPPRT
jgi:hypothetical protein